MNDMLREVAAGVKPFAQWLPVSVAIGRSRNEKLEIYLKLLYELLRDILLTGQGRSGIRNQDLRRELEELAPRFPPERIVAAVRKVDQMVELVPRNIQNIIALDDWILEIQAFGF